MLGTDVPERTDDARHPDGFVVTYEGEYGPLVRLAFPLTRDRDAAQDVVQQAFVNAYRRWDTLDAPEAYLRRSVVNRCHSHHRTNKRAGELTVRIGAGFTPTDVPLDYILDALATLDTKHRTAVVLRYYLDLSADDIALAMGIRRGSVGPTLTRALRRLRQELAP